MQNIRKQFENYLINCGYKQFTEFGQPSTVYSYLNKVEQVLLWENLTWEELANNIANVCELYEKGGINEKKGEFSHRTVINALKRFETFVKTFKI